MPTEAATDRLLASIVMDASTELHLACRRAGIAPTEADLAAFDTGDTDALIDWVESVEDRCGFALPDLREHAIDYALVHDGAGCPEEQDHIDTLFSVYEVDPEQE